jgi:hypothetical protein
MKNRPPSAHLCCVGVVAAAIVITALPCAIGARAAALCLNRRWFLRVELRFMLA